MSLLSSLLFPLYSACELLQDVPGKHTKTADLRPFLHQLKQNVFPSLTNYDQVLHFHNQFPTTKLRFRPLPGWSQLISPWPDELALQDQTAERPAIDNRDLQHAIVPTCDKSKGDTKLAGPEVAEFRKEKRERSKVSTVKKVKESKRRGYW
jgi:hypothetical protein